MKKVINLLVFIALLTASFAQQVSTNVDYYTGTAHINLPLGEYESGGFTLPVSLGYTASGIRLSQTASWVGLGWELNAGGFITREIRNLPDDKYKEEDSDPAEFGWLYWNDCQPASSFLAKVQNYDPSGTGINRWGSIAEIRGDGDTIHDSEPDIFSINMAGIAASFIFPPGTSGQQPGEREVLFLGDENYIVEYTLSSSNQEIESFTVTDDRGVIYIFSDKERIRSNMATVVTDTIFHDVTSNQFPQNFLPDQSPSKPLGFATITGQGYFINEPAHNNGSSPSSSTYELRTYKLGAGMNENISSWFLTKIITPFKQEIDFVYRDEWIQLDETVFEKHRETQNGFSSPIAKIVSNYIDYGDNNGLPSSIYSFWNPGPSSSIDEVPLLKTKKIDSITSNNFKINFYAGTIREDLDDENIDSGYEPKRLDSIKVYSNVSGTYIQKKAYHLDYSYPDDVGSPFPAPYEKRLRLDSLIISNGDLSLPPYKFTYNADAELPSRFSYAQDIWGYYNYETSNSTYVPEAFVYKSLTGSDRFRLIEVEEPEYPYDTMYTLPGADRQPDEDAVTEGILNKIIYPTGGYIQFEYESNEFIYNNGISEEDENVYKGAGVRIKKKTISDGINSSTNIVEEYVYQYNSGGCSGHLVDMPRFGYFDPRSWEPTKDMAYYDKNYIRTTSDLTKYTDGLIFYDEVQIKQSGNGKQVISYHPAPSRFSDPEDYLYYDVPEIDTLREWQDQLESLFPNLEGIYLTEFAYPFIYSNNYNWNRGLVDSVKIFNETGTVLQKTENFFIDYFKNDSAPQQVHGLMIDYLFNNSWLSIPQGDLRYPLILVAKYSINTGVGKRVIKTRSTTYDPDNSGRLLVLETDFSYNEYGQLSESKTGKSNGDTAIIKYRYPLDYDYLSKPYISGSDEYSKAISEMVHDNQLNAPIETIKILQKTESSTTTRYVLGSQMNLPYLKIINDDTIPLQVISLSYHLDSLQQESYYTYCDINTSGQFTSLPSNWDTIAWVGQYDDRGNMLDMYPQNGSPSAIIWGYDSTYKIAEISNASYAEAGYTGFENGESNGWTLSSTGILIEKQIDDFYSQYKTKGGNYTAKSTGGKIYRYFKRSEMGENFDTEGGYKASVWVKGSGGAKLSMKIYDGTTQLDSVQQSSTSGDTTWQLLEVVMTKDHFEQVAGTVDSIYVELGNNGTQVLHIDEMRFLPADALMTTYSYKPGFGVISQAGPNNIFNYYHYDDLSRLSWVRNHNGDIITHKEYVVNSDFATNGPTSILTRSILKEGIFNVLDATELQSGDVLETYEYMDGLARVIQTVNKGASPNHKDFVNVSVFNKYGQQDMYYLPYASSDDNDGSYKSNAISEIFDFYSTSGSKVAYSNFPYAEINYSASPNSYIEEKGNVGYDWQIAQGNTRQFDFTCNLTNEVVWFRYDMDDGDVDTQTGQVYYPVNRLSVTEIKDENGNISLNYSDKSGKIIATKVEMGEDDLWTYFVYDDFGQMMFKITPKAFAQMQASPVDYSFSWSSDIFEDLIYGYKYDAKGRLTKTKVPGKAVEYIIYDNLNRPIMSQDGNLRQNNEWKVSKYDIHGRVVITAIEGFASAKSQSAMQTDVDNFYSNSNNLNYEVFYGIGTSHPHGYTNRSFPANVDEDDVLTVQYFDNYDFDINSAVPFTQVTELSLDSFTDKTIGLSTGSKIKVLDGSNDTCLLSAVYYDDFQRVVQTVSENHIGGYDRVSNKLYFSGWVSRSNHTQFDGIDSIVERRYYSYDHAGRLRKLNYDIDEGNTFTMYKNTFNELGQTIEKNLHGDIEQQTFLQSIDYKYNIRGWLTNINNSNYTNENNIIAFDQYLSSNEVVDGLVYDTLKISINTNDTSRVRIYFEDSKYFQIDNLSNPSLDRNLQYDETQYITLYSGETPQEEFNIFKNYLDEDFVFVFDSLNITDNWQLQDIVDSISSMVEARLPYQGVTEEEEILAFIEKVQGYISERVALVYFNEDSDDLYGMDILYNEGLDDLNGDKQYNGLVSGIRWQAQYYEGIRGYGYEYDKAYRMTDANYGLWDHGWGGSNRYGVNDISFDANGNILTLERNGQVDQDGTNPFGLIDDLTYTYEGNMLTRVDDSQSSTYTTNDFEDNGSQSSNEYLYDYNGNLVKDENKGIDTIKYNYLNLPEEIIFDATHKIIYLYNALGNRLKKKIVSGQNSMVTDYVSNMVYLDDTLQMVMTEEGRMLALDSGGFQAEYFLKDHLGNNRLTISDADEDGDAEIVQEDHFYPYGMTMSGLSYRGSTVNNYLFQGKEQQSNFNLWWYDFGARMFDEQLGRWHVPDPKLQFSSPYVGMGNNPASNIDPDGRRSFGAERYPDFFSLWAAQKACSDKQMEWNSYVASWSATGTNKNRETAVIYLLIGSDGIGDESEGFGNSMIVSDEFTKNYIRKQIDGGTIAQVYAIVDALMNDNELFNLWAAGGNPKIYIIPISDDRVKEDGGMETIFPITAAAETNRLVGSRKVLDEENNLVRWNSKIDLYPKAFTDNLLSVTLGHEFYHAKHNFDGSISNWSYNESPIKGDLTYGIIKSEIAAYQYNINKTDVQDPYYQQWKELQNYYQLYLQLYPQRPIYTP